MNYQEFEKIKLEVNGETLFDVEKTMNRIKEVDQTVHQHLSEIIKLMLNPNNNLDISVRGMVVPTLLFQLKSFDEMLDKTKAPTQPTELQRINKLIKEKYPHLTFGDIDCMTETQVSSAIEALKHDDNAELRLIGEIMKSQSKTLEPKSSLLLLFFDTNKFDHEAYRQEQVELMSRIIEMTKKQLGVDGSLQADEEPKTYVTNTGTGISGLMDLFSGTKQPKKRFIED